MRHCLGKLVFLVWCAGGILRAGEDLPWSDDLSAVLRAAAGDGKPVLALIRHGSDVGSLDAAEWLREDNAFAPLLEKFHRAVVWSGDVALKGLSFAPRSGLLFLTPRGELIAVEEVPPLRGELKPLLSRILEKPEALDENAKAALSKAGEARQDRAVKALPQDLKAQFKELLANLQAAAKDPQAARKALEQVRALLARPMSQDECQHSAGLLNHVIMELDFNDERQGLIQKIRKEAPVGRVAADAYLDLADESYAKGARDEALKLWEAAEKAAGKGESPTLLRTAQAMRALAREEFGAARKKWEQRKVLDIVVLAPNLASFANAIACWTEKAFFPVLLKEDLYAPRFIAAFKPAFVVLAPEAAATAELAPETIRETIFKSWSGADSSPDSGPSARLQAGRSVEHLRERLKELGFAASGVVFSDGASGETAGGLALAAGRFQGFEFLPVPKIGQGNDERSAKAGDELPRPAAFALARDVLAGLKRWGLPDGAAWSYVTLAGAYPYRYAGGQDGYKFGKSYALDDLLGRNENLVRIAPAGRLLGDAARSAYQAACSLFLKPESALLFNTYGTNPRSIWGAYRTDFAEAQWKDRLAITHLKDKDAAIETFRARVFPWNKTQLIIINSSGGATDWSVGSGGGTTDDFPVGGPVAIHVTHSGSAANPYDPDTLAGRAIWGGAFFYFGSVAEPFLSAFQPPRYFAPRIAAGAPFAAAFRQRTGQYFGYPWRLMIVGDPQFCLRKEPAKRQPFDPGKSPIAKAGAKVLPCAEYLAAVPSWLAGDTAKSAALWREAPPEDAPAKYAARVYARQQISHDMDQALAASDLAGLQGNIPALLSTQPARNFVERWCGKLADLAESKKEETALAAWLEKQAAEATPESFRSVFASRLNQVKLAALKRKEHWADADKSAALQCFASAVKNKAEAKALAAQLQELTDLCAKRLPGATAEGILAEAKALFPADSTEARRVESALKELEKKRTPPK